MSFNDTIDLERSLLRQLTKSLMICRKYIQGVRVDWFTSQERRFVFEVMMSTFKSSKAVLTSKVFEYEVNKVIEDEERNHYIGEWDYIEAVQVTEPSEALIDRLREAHSGRLMMDEIEKVVMKAEEGDVLEAVSMFKRAAVSMNTSKDDLPIVELTDYKRRKAIIEDKKAHPEKYLGIKTGLPTFDRQTGGLFKEELTLIAGVTGLGKSTLVKQLEKGIITQNKNKNVLHIANEESQDQVESKFDALMTEIPYLDFKLARISDEDLEKWEETMTQELKKPGVGRVFIKEVPAFTDVTLVEQAYRELEAKGVKIDVILIDHLPHVVPIEKSWGENDEKAKAAADCKQLAKDLKCAVVIPTQAATVVEEKQSKGKRAGKLDVHGAKAVIHVANTFIMITDRGKVPDDNLEDWQRDVNWLVDIKKNRDGPGFSFRARHYVQYGKVVEVFEKEEEEDNEEHAAGAKEKEAIQEALKEIDEESEEDSEESKDAPDEGRGDKPIKKVKKTVKMPNIDGVPGV